MKFTKKQKDIFQRSMSYRKKHYFKFKSGAVRWSKDVEWYTYTDLNRHITEGTRHFWDDIFIPSKKYNKIFYIALLETVDLAAEDALDDIMHNMAAKRLGYNDYDEYIDATADSKEERERKMRLYTTYDKKRDTYNVNPALFEPEYMPDYEFMSFTEIAYGIVWPEIRDKIETICQPIYSTTEIEVCRSKLLFSKILDVHDLTIDVIDKFVLDFWANGEKRCKVKDETTLCYPNWDIVRNDYDEISERYRVSEETLAERRARLG